LSIIIVVSVSTSTKSPAETKFYLQSKYKKCLLTMNPKTKALTCSTKNTSADYQLWKQVVSGSVVRIISSSNGFFLNNKGTMQKTIKGKGKKSTKFMFNNGALVAENKKVLTVVKKGKKMLLKILKAKKRKGFPISTQNWELKAI
jgi:hypothetical protein